MMRLASKQASKSSYWKHHLGAVIVKGNRVMSTGYNEIRYSKELKKNNLHAEEAAILKLLKAKRLGDLIGGTIFVSRVCPSGRIGLAKPCTSCQDLIKSVGLDKVVFTLDGGETEEYYC